MLAQTWPSSGGRPLSVRSFADENEYGIFRGVSTRFRGCFWRAIALA